MRDRVAKYIYRLWAYIFAKPGFAAFNRIIYGISLRGLGVLNYETAYLSGERNWLKNFVSGRDAPVVFDVGANVGVYSKHVLLACPGAVIYAFEPHPRTFSKLQEASATSDIKLFNKAVSDNNSTIFLYDYEEHDGSSHASLYKEVIEGVHRAESIAHSVESIKLDTFCSELGVECIDLLKIDTEGNELNCLIGAQNLLSAGKVRAIQFEFNEMNVISGSRFKDFWDLLSDFDIYRLLPAGRLLKLKKYSPLFCEIYAYQNIIALRRR